MDIRYGVCYLLSQGSKRATLSITTSDHGHPSATIYLCYFLLSVKHRRVTNSGDSPQKKKKEKRGGGNPTESHNAIFRDESGWVSSTQKNTPFYLLTT